MFASFRAVSIQLQVVSRRFEQKNETRSRLRVLGSLICNKALEFFFFAIPYIIANSCNFVSLFFLVLSFPEALSCVYARGVRPHE